MPTTAHIDAIDWGALQCAYGDASEAGALLASLMDPQHQQDWNDIWSHLCHQGTVYTASHAALPVLLAIARQSGRRDRDDALLLAGAIVAGSDVGDPGLVPHGDVIQALRGKVQQRLQSSGKDAVPLSDDGHGERGWLRQAWLGLSGEKAWSLHLDRLAEGEIAGECAACSAELYCSLVADAPYVCHEDPVSGVPSAMTALLPGEPVGVAEHWLMQQVRGDGDVVAERLLGLAFGHSTCSACGHPFAVRDCMQA
ncbi:hypothetical protein [Stenotrophomonas tuberculopleuritidis]|uniref:hypothetical protein n=1 Tax=Stenotrophomonas tuberculopleuritidis TaxID=3055079 RepID=UPI0026E51E14|nr:hypothetical protein [Stenotrophomonas sp. 704A1]